MKPAMTSAQLVHELLFRALIELREQGRKGKDDIVFHLADLFHNTVADLGQAAEGKMTYDAVLLALDKKASEKGIARWIQVAIADIERKPISESSE